MSRTSEEARAAFDQAPITSEWGGVRIKEIRAGALRPGGRVSLHLFERAEEGPRPHPRLRVSLPPAEDSDAGPVLGAVEGAPPADAAAFEAWLTAAWAEAAGRVDPGLPEEGASRAYRRNSVRAQRTARFLTEATRQRDAWLADGALPAGARDASDYALAALADRAFATDAEVVFDDEDTGTYHSFGKDKPFVHYLEALLASLPAEDTPAFDLHDGFQQEALRRQADQLQHHLDHLMRHKYAYKGIVETDIEQSLGGFLIDRETREVVSEDPASSDSLQPRYQRLRIAEESGHAHAGAPVYRHGETLRLPDGQPVEVSEHDLRAAPVEAADLTFRRAPGDPGLRPGVRFDWNGDGFVQSGEIGWIGWAGHCDIKAIMEQLGLALTDGEQVTEYRSDTGGTLVLGRDLLIEMIASAMELGSLYTRADRSGTLRRGLTRFGGARNDSRPDRLQFQGLGPGRSFRWPLGGRQDSFRITRITEPATSAREAADLDMDLAFYRHTPEPEVPRFTENPRFLKTVEGDYNLIDVSGALLEATLQEDGFDAQSGYPTRTAVQTRIALGADPEEPLQYLGTHVQDAAAREIFKVWLDRGAGRILARLYRWEKGAEGWAPAEQPDEEVSIPLVDPLSVTLSREMKRDDPAAFQSLLQQTLRHGQNICADTDMKSEVWNGVVTRVHARQLAESREERTEHWRVDIKARFGRAALEYLVRRDARGRPEAWTPAKGEESHAATPDFLWQDFPDVGTKGRIDGAWVINQTMLERGIVDVRPRAAAPGGFYVHDEHIKSCYELLYAALSGHRWTIVHRNKRYGFTEEAAWQSAVAELQGLRVGLRVRGLDGEERPLEAPASGA
jgi:hypothetical protein